MKCSNRHTESAKGSFSNTAAKKRRRPYSKDSWVNSRRCQIGTYDTDFVSAEKRQHPELTALLGAFYPFCHPIGFESGRVQPLSGTQGKRVATFALVTTVGPQPRPARSTPVNLAACQPSSFCQLGPSGKSAPISSIRRARQGPLFPCLDPPGSQKLFPSLSPSPSTLCMH